MKKFKLGFIFSLILILGSISFPELSFASDSGGTAREVAQDATEADWNLMKDFFVQTGMPADDGYTKGYQMFTDFKVQCNDWQRNEYAYTGEAKRIIKSITSSDPSTISVNYTSNNIELKRESGTSPKVTINIEYQINWSFHVKEDVAGVWWSVNDQVGSTTTFTDSFTISVAQKHLTVIPKQLNNIQLNLFDPKTDNPLNFVDYSGNTGQVTYYMKKKPDDSILGNTTGTFIFSDDSDAVSVDIPFTVVDTTPPSGLLKNPIEVEIGDSLIQDDLFDSSPYDNDFQDVKVSKSIDPNSLKIGTYPIAVDLTDSSGNVTSLSSTVIVKDTTPPTVKTKDIVVDYGETVKPEDFIESATDNDSTSNISYIFDALNGNSPDTLKAGEQTVSIFAFDQSRNGITVTAKLTVDKDKVAPSAKGIPQFIEQNDSMPADCLSLLTNLQDNSPISTLTAAYISQPVTNVIGLNSAKVRLSDVSGNSSDIKVPVFVMPKNSAHDDNTVLSGENFTVYSDQVDLGDKDALENLILNESKAKAWNATDGSDISSKIIVANHNIQKKFGSYEATLSVGNLNKKISVNVLDSKDLVDVSIPKSISFGSTDVDNGNIISPEYEIKNNSSVNLKISLTEVDVAQNSTVSLLNNNELTPSQAEESVKLLFDCGLMNNPIELQQGQASLTIGTLSGNKGTTFSLNGHYYGDYSTQGYLKLDLIFKLEALH